MCVNHVVERFELISGLSPEEVSDWIFLCAQACDYIQSLRTDCGENLIYNEKRLENAAAVYAYYRYCTYTCEELKSFRAGDVEVSRGESMMKRAESMWNKEKAGLSDLLNVGDDNFCFFRMRGGF